MASFESDRSIIDLECELISVDVDSLEQKPMLVDISQADNEETRAETEADEMKENTPNTGSTNNANIRTDGVENNIVETKESNVDSPGQNQMLVDIFQADNEQIVVELEADEIKANKPKTVSKIDTNIRADGVEKKIFETVDSNVDSLGQKPVLLDMFYPDSEPTECQLEADEIKENTPNLNLQDSDKEYSYSSIIQNKDKEKEKKKNMDNVEKNFLDPLFVTETAKTCKGLSETVKQTSAAENLPSVDEKRSSAVRYFPMPVVQPTACIRPIVYCPVSSQGMGMALPIQTPLPAVQSQIEPVRVFANRAIKALLNRPPQPSLQPNITLVTQQPREHTSIQPMPVTVFPNQTQTSQFSAETKVMKKKKNVVKTSGCKSSSIDSCKTVSLGISKSLKTKLSGRGKTADLSTESKTETGHPCADESAQNVVQENGGPEIIPMLPVTVKVNKVECVCCKDENHLINIKNSTLKKEGFPEILFRYGGITKARYKDSYICRECRAEVVMAHNRVKKFFKKCKKNAQKTGQLTVTKIPSLNEDEYEQLREKCVSKTAVSKALPKVVQSTQLNQAINTFVPGQSITSLPVLVVPSLPKNTCDACTQTQPVSSKFRKLRSKDTGDTTATETPLKEEVIFDQLLKEKVSVDHDYEQSTSDEQRADFVKKAEIEELKTKLYSEDKIEGVSVQSLILEYCGCYIRSSEFCQQLLLSQELKNAFQAATLKDVSFNASLLQTRKVKLSYISELRKKGHDNFSSVSWTVLFREFCDHFPFVVKALIAISNIPAEKLSCAIPRLGMIYGMLMQLRDTDLNRVQRLVSKCLVENLVPKKVFQQLSPMGICLHYTNTCKLLQGGPHSHTSPFSVEELRKNKAARESRKKCNIKASDKIRKRDAQFTSKSQDSNKGREGNPEETAAEGEPPDKKLHFEASAGDEVPAKVDGRRRKAADWNTLTPNEQKSAILCEKTGKVTLKRKKHILSVKTCEKEQSVNSWTPEDLTKCHIKYTSDWISSSPYDNLDIIPVKYLPAELSVEEESVLGHLNELFGLDIDINNLGEEELGKTIENLTKTVTMLEESDNMVQDETQETQMMYECAVDWLRVILQILIRQQSGLSYHREEAIQMVNAFVRCFGFGKEGESETGEDPFRQWFAQLGEVRSLIQCPVLLMTATASKTARKSLKQKFARKSLKQKFAMTNCRDLIQNPDRDNIKLFVSRIKPSTPLCEVFFFLISMLKRLLEQCPRYLIFCTSIKDCAALFTMFRLELTSDELKHVNMFHSKTSHSVKKEIKEDMENSDGKIRILIASSAAGMGVNYKSVNNVVNYGPPKEMDNFLQQIGRAGRDGTSSKSLLLYHGRQCRNLDTDMADYISNKEDCRRQILLSCYKASPSSTTLRHACCDVCSLKCSCNMKECEQFGHPFLESQFTNASSGTDSSSDTESYASDDK